MALSVEFFSHGLEVLLVLAFALSEVLFHVLVGIFQTGYFVGRLDLEPGVLYVADLHFVLDLVSLELRLCKSGLEVQLRVSFH